MTPPCSVALVVLEGDVEDETVFVTVVASDAAMEAEVAMARRGRADCLGVDKEEEMRKSKMTCDGE